MKKQACLSLYLCLMFSHIAISQEWNLENCLSYAYLNNKEILVDSKNLSLIGVDRKKSFSKLLPDLTFDADMDHYWEIPIQAYPAEIFGGEPRTTVTVPVGTSWTSNYGLTANLNLVSVDTWKTIKMYSLKKQAVQSSTKSLKKLLKKNVTIAYYSMQLQDKNRKIALERFEKYKLIHELILKQFNQGIIDKISLNYSISLLSELEENLKNKEADFQKSSLDLKFWIGFPLKKPLTVSRLEVIPSFLPGDFDVSLLPDFDKEKSKIELEKQKYLINKSSFYPKLSLVANYKKSGFGDDFEELRQGQSQFSSGFLGLRLSIPLLSANNIYNIKKQRIAINKSELEFEEYKEEREKTFLTNSIEMNNIIKVIKYGKKRLALSKENEDLSLEKIEKGIINMTELKKIQEEFLDAQDRLSLAELEYLKLYVKQNYLQSNN